MKHFFLSLLLSITVISAFSQGKVQIIHNSADPSAEFVDIYLNGTILLNNFQFRRATPFLSVPVGIHTIQVKDSSSTGLTPSLFTTTLQVQNNVNYIAVASGVVNLSAFPASQPFQIAVLDNARENLAVTPPVGVNRNDIVIFHGGSDAPLLQIQRFGNQDTVLNPSIAFGSFGNGYFTTNTANFNLRVSTTGTNFALGQYAANLQSLSLNNRTITVLASGLINNAGPNNRFGLFAVTAAGGNFLALPAVAYPPAQVQVIHNSADLAASPVDIWVNDTKVADDLTFRNATPFLNVPVSTLMDAPTEIRICSSASTDTTNPVFFTTARFNSTRHVAIANGIVSADGYAPGSNERPLNLFVRSFDSNLFTNPASCNVLVFHGCTDADVVDVRELISNSTLLNDFSYGNFSAFLSLPAQNYALEITNQAGNIAYASYIAELGKLGLQGKTITVVASGFLDPTLNSDGPAFGLWVATENGGQLLELQAPVNPKINIIHNSGDLGMKNLILKIDGNVVNNNFQFRQHTSFQDITNGNHLIQIATATNPNNNIITHAITTNFNYNYVVVLDGIATPSGYNPPSVQNPIRFFSYRDGLTQSTQPNVASVQFHHGATDAPALRLAVNSIGVVDSSIVYSEFSDYFNLNNQPYTLSLNLLSDNSNFANFTLPVSTQNWIGKAITVVASGFLNTSLNSNGQAFGLFAAVQGTANLVPLAQVLGNEIIADNAGLIVYPNPARDFITVSFEKPEIGTMQLIDLSGRIVSNETLNQSQNVQIQTEGLSSGIYTLRVVTSNEIKTIKVQISK